MPCPCVPSPFKGKGQGEGSSASRPRRAAQRAAAPLAALAAALLLAGCTRADSSADVSADVLQGALAGCMAGAADAQIARLDSLVSASGRNADALAVRGLCRWARFAADSARVDAEGAYADFSDAARAVEASPGRFSTPLDRIYSQRAFVALALRPGDWPAVVADLTRAVEAAPAEPTPVLDRGVAHREAGDTAAARRDFERFLALAPADSARGDLVRQMLADMRAAAAPTTSP